MATEHTRDGSMRHERTTTHRRRWRWLAVAVPLTLAQSAHAQDPFADAVVSFSPGMGAGFGADQLPGIVLGAPQGGGELSGSLDVVSLGNNGVIVRNADADGSIPIRLTASGCDAFATATVDFDQRTAGAQDTSTVRSGRRRAASVTLSIDGASVTTPDRHQPVQCGLTFSAATNVPGNVDPTPADNIANIELIVLDKNDFN